ncbi:hypothetical protein NUW54_g6379 [Trametes sanguinea]|uniref:Uncharacterized protein n=1 Tax=Trametes sanguinea TaxID=158606 RepID=A0ACC1PU39_9APHY|nr:hypothetical protein NUW54_g6379 [Trametes sanguinea]
MPLASCGNAACFVSLLTGSTPALCIIFGHFSAGIGCILAPKALRAGCISPTEAIACLAAGSLYLWRYIVRNGRPRTLPPGPPGLPIIGNLLDVPTKQLAAGYRKLSDDYGDLVYLDAFGQPILVLGSHATAVDLLEKWSALYSDRLPTPMIQLTAADSSGY